MDQTSKDRESTLLVVGSANMDLVVTCDRFPEPGETVFGGSFATYPGGKGANQAVAAARLEGDVLLLAKLGSDAFGDELEHHLRESGVHVEYLLRDETAPTGVALITVEGSGQNEILVVSGSNMELSPDDVVAHRDLFDGVSTLLLQLETPIPTAQAAAEIARDRGVAVVLNPAPAAELPDELLQKVDYLTPNELEAEKLSGVAVRDLDSAEQAALRLLARGVRNVIVTLGATGALRVHKDGVQFAAAPVVDAVDSTAAGDAFNGAFARALSWRWAASEALEFAVYAASFSVTRPGAQPSLPSLNDLISFITPELRARLLRVARPY
ncbi:MAG TPA: ribokinase [Rhodothermales bacterium]|nr:ribokinase [Rhodothermales bacterium]